MAKRIKDHRCKSSCEDFGTKSERGQGRGGELPALASREEGSSRRKGKLALVFVNSQTHQSDSITAQMIRQNLLV